MFVNGSELNEQSLQRPFQGCFLPSFDSFGQAVSEEKIFQKSTNQKQEWSVAAMFVNRSGQNDQSLQRTFHRCFLPNFSSFGKWLPFQRRRFFKNQPIKNKNGLWWPCLLTDRDEMSNLNRGPSIDHRCFLPSFGSFDRAVSEERIFKNWPIRNKNGLWQPCLLMDRDKISNLYRGSSIDATYQISIHLGKRFQRRRFFRNQPIKNKNDLWWQCLLTDRN